MVLINFKNTSLKFWKKIQKETLRTGIVVIVVILLTWGISIATTDDYESATDNFSVIGTVMSVSDDMISLTHARGTDTSEDDLYDLNIKHLDKVETKDYNPLIISDIKPGDTIIAQGLTNGTTFFIKRIVSFADTPLPVQDDTATTTPEIATSTIESQTDISTSTTDEISTSSDNTVLPESVEEINSTQEEQNQNTETATTTVIETMTDILEDGITGASEVLDMIVETVTRDSQEQPANTIETESVSSESQQL